MIFYRAVPRTAHSGWPVFAQSDGPYRKLWKRWVSQEIHFQCPRYIDFGGRPSRTFSSSTHWTSSGSFCDVDPSDAGHFNPPKGLIPFPFPFSRSLDARAYKTVQSKMVSWWLSLAHGRESSQSVYEAIIVSWENDLSSN